MDPLALAVLAQVNIRQHQRAMDHQIALLQLLRRRRRRRNRRVRLIWTSRWLYEQERRQNGQYYQLVMFMKANNPRLFFNYMRVEPALFDEILERITPRIMGVGNNYRPSIEAGLKLSATLRYLATGDSYASIAYNYRVHYSTVSHIVPDVCEAIKLEYQNEVIKFPTTAEEWLAVARDFEQRWNVPHAIGALDGKHVKIKCPPNSGSNYWCVYKHCYSIVLLALVDADYKFIWADTGGVGHMSDCQIFNQSELKEVMENDEVSVPPPRPLPNDGPHEDSPEAPEDAEDGDDEDGDQRPVKDIPYFILSDDAFPLKTYLIKPMSRKQMTRRQHIFNYRISRARRVVENAFGIMAARWRCLLCVLEQHPAVLKLIIEACICLHNLMRIRNPNIARQEVDVENEDHVMVEGAWRREVQPEFQDPGLPRVHNSREGMRNRDYLINYFNDPNRGAVPWQDDMVNLRND